MFFLKIYKSVNQFKATANYSNLTQHWLNLVHTFLCINIHSGIWDPNNRNVCHPKTDRFPNCMIVTWVDYL